MDIEFVVDEYIEKGKLIGDNETVDAIIAELAAAKEEIALVDAYKQHWLDTDKRCGELQSALTSERKETERLRELLRDAFDPMQHMVACQKRHMEKCMCHECIKERAKAALQSRQGEE